MAKYTKESVLVLLRNKYETLCATGEKRYPRRSDFSDEEVCAIKAYLGPWPRALESAGIKQQRNDDRLARNREKRIRAKRNRRLQRALPHDPEAENDCRFPHYIHSNEQNKEQPL